MIDWMVDRLIDDKDKDKKEMCANCKKYLDEVNISDDNCPIVLEKMTFHFFSHYMSTKTSKNLGGYLSDTSYGGFQSYLTNMYHMSGKTMDGEFNKEIYQSMLRIQIVNVSNKR